jgi:hypothetical protein
VPVSTVRFSPDQVDLVFDAISFGSGATSPGQARFTNLDQ